jgi:SEC-C motif
MRRRRHPRLTWLADETGAPTHMCVVPHGLHPNKMVLRRDALVQLLYTLPNGEANNRRRLDILGVVSGRGSWASGSTTPRRSSTVRGPARDRSTHPDHDVIKHRLPRVLLMSAAPSRLQHVHHDVEGAEMQGNERDLDSVVRQLLQADRDIAEHARTEILALGPAAVPALLRILEARESVEKPARPGRNEPCWCGSARKYKKFHLAADRDRVSAGEIRI